MSTVPETVAQRLEELSLELGNNELLALAEELSQWNPPSPPSSPQQPRERQAQRMLEQIVMMLSREGYRVPDPHIDSREYWIQERYRNQVLRPSDAIKIV